MPSREEQIAAFYAVHRDHLLHTVEREVFAAPTLVEDACQFAWMQLLRHPAVAVDRRGFWWLHRVAVREAWRIAKWNRHTVTLHAPASDLDVETIPLDYLASHDDVPLMVERREQLRVVDQLPSRQRRVIVMRAMGLKYAEIARITGETQRSVERQLRLAFAHLRKADVAADRGQP